MSYAPSLFGDSTPSVRPAVEPTCQVRSLLDLLYDGFFMLFLLKNGREPGEAGEFSQRIQQFLGDFEHGAKKLNASADDVYASKFAFCAAVDESVLSSSFKIRMEWERFPLPGRMPHTGCGAPAVAGGVSHVPAARFPGQISAGRAR
jgi:type VI secretion system protein ImpK